MTFGRALLAWAVLLVGSAAANAQSSSTGDAGWIGITLRDKITPAQRQVRVVSVAEGGPAELAGIRIGDIVVSVDGVAADSTIGAVGVIRSHRPGDVISVVLSRGDGREAVQVRASATPQSPVGGECMYGDITDGLWRSITTKRGDSAPSPMFISALGADQIRWGLRVNDQILSMDGKPTQTFEDYRRLLAAHFPGDTIRLGIVRGGSPLTIKLPAVCSSYTDPVWLRAASAQWRNLPVRPPLPRVTDTHRKRAELAYQANDLVTAYLEYDAGLASYLLWPEGWFNSSMIAAKRDEYQDAANRAGLYLELSPNAPDADSVRARIAEWTERARHSRAVTDFSAGECKYGGASLGILFSAAPKGPMGQGRTVLSVAGPAARAGIPALRSPGSDTLNDRWAEVMNVDDIDFKRDTAALTKYYDLLSAHHSGDIFRVKIARKNERDQELRIAAECGINFDWNWFRGTARTWRGLTDKPPLPELVDKYRVLAEEAIREKNFYAAAFYYQEGLASFPWWPQGWYNLALTEAQSRDFGGAADYMSLYLELVPDGPDSKAAREQMYIWQEKAKK